MKRNSSRFLGLCSVLIIYFLIMTPFFAGCGSSGGSGGDSNGKDNSLTLESKLDTQNKNAERYVSKAFDFVRGYEQLESIIDDQSTSDESKVNELKMLLENKMIPLAGEYYTAINEVMEIEQDLQNVMSLNTDKNIDMRINDNVERDRIMTLGPVAIAGILALLAIAAGGAGASKIAIDEYSKCTKYGNPNPNPPGADPMSAPQILRCVVENAPEITGEAIFTAFVEGTKELGEWALPAGKVRTVVKTYNAGEDIKTIHDFIGVQPGCLTGQQQSQNVYLSSESTEAELMYIGRSEDGVFHHVPEGDWAFYMSTPDHARTFIPCVRVTEDKTTEISVFVIPMNEANADILNPDHDSDGYNSTASGGDDCNDDDPSIHPGATEIIGDGIDQDCDGVDSVIAVKKYHVFKHSGTGYRKMWGGWANKITGYGYYYEYIYPDEVQGIIDRDSNFAEKTAGACEGGPALCPCAPYPDIWVDGSVEVVGSFETSAELDPYRCDNPHYMGYQYICNMWETESAQGDTFWDPINGICGG